VGAAEVGQVVVEESEHIIGQFVSGTTGTLDTRSACWTAIGDDITSVRPFREASVKVNAAIMVRVPWLVAVNSNIQRENEDIGNR